MPNVKSFSSSTLEYRDDNDGQDASAQLVTLSDLSEALSLPEESDIKVTGIRVQVLSGTGSSTLAILKKKADATTVTLLSAATVAVSSASITQLQLTSTEADLVLTDGEALSFQRAGGNSQSVIYVEYGGVGTGEITVTT